MKRNDITAVTTDVGSDTNVERHDVGRREETGEETITVPVLAEELSVGKRVVETGQAHIIRTVSERMETVDEPLLREDVEIERVPVNRPIEGPVAVRHEGDTMIVSVVEEVLVVEKRLMLKEELHIRRRQNVYHAPQQVSLRSENVTVERVEPEVSAITSDAIR